MSIGVASSERMHEPRTYSALLTVGFLSFAVAVAAASRDPATGYELSIYGATTPVFWGGIALATAASVVAAFSEVDWVRRLGLGLACGSMFAIVLLPLIRGYYFYGTADPLAHLGWARLLAGGELGPRALIYPGIHSVSAMLGGLADWPIRRAMLLVTASFTLVYVVFVALTVQVLAPGRTHAAAVGTLSALLLLPINHVGMHLRTHPFSQTTLFSALVIFALAVYVTRVDADGVGGVGTSEGLVLTLVAGASILYHPQTAADVLLVFAGISALQFLDGRGVLDLRLRDHGSLHGPTAVFGVCYALWALPATWFHRAVGLLYWQLLVPLAHGNPPMVGDRIASQSASLLAIGSGPLEIFLKLFVPTTVFVGLAGLFVYAVLSGRVDTRRVENTVSGTYFVVGTLIAVGLVVVYFVASIAEMYFRHLGLAMVFVTLLGALTIVRWLDGGAGGRSPSRSPTAIKVVVVVGFLVLLPLTGAVAYQSPYIHKANQHVTEQEMAGYEWTFDAAAGEAPVAGVRTSPKRFQQAIEGDDGASASTPGLAGAEVASLSSSVPAGSYVVLSDRDVRREVEPYRELRYSRAQFDAVARQPGVNRVHANGESRVYLVSGATDEAG